MLFHLGRDLALDVREAGASLQLVFVDCDASFPGDLDLATFHPLIIYIQIPRRKVCDPPTMVGRGWVGEGMVRRDGWGRRWERDGGERDGGISA